MRPWREYRGGGDVIVGREHRHHLGLEVGLRVGLEIGLQAATTTTTAAAICHPSATAAVGHLLVHKGGTGPGVGVSC